MTGTRQSEPTGEEVVRFRERFFFMESFWNQVLSFPSGMSMTVLEKAQALSPDVRGTGENDIVKIALRSVRGDRQFSPLMVAAGRGLPNMVDDLITLAESVGGTEFVQAILDARNTRGETAQDIAYATGYDRIGLRLVCLWTEMKLLAEMKLQPDTSGVVINGQNPNGQPPSPGAT